MASRESSMAPSSDSSASRLCGGTRPFARRRTESIVWTTASPTSPSKPGPHSAARGAALEGAQGCGRRGDNPLPYPQGCGRVASAPVEYCTRGTTLIERSGSASPPRTSHSAKERPTGRSPERRLVRRASCPQAPGRPRAPAPATGSKKSRAGGRHRECRRTAGRRTRVAPARGRGLLGDLTGFVRR